MVVKVRTVLLFGTMMDLLSGNTKLFALKEVNEKGVTYEYTRGIHEGYLFSLEFVDKSDYLHGKGTLRAVLAKSGANKPVYKSQPIYISDKKVDDKYGLIDETNYGLCCDICRVLAGWIIAANKRVNFFTNSAILPVTLNDILKDTLRSVPWDEEDWQFWRNMHKEKFQGIRGFNWPMIAKCNHWLFCCHFWYTETWLVVGG